MNIERNRWTEYLAELSRQAEGFEAGVEVLDEQLGDQIEARRAPLLEIGFEPREGIAISLGDRMGHAEVVRRVIAHPARLETTDEPGVPSAVRITDDAGTQTLVRLSPA